MKQFWSSLDTPRRKRKFAVICCLLATLILGLILLGILLHFLYDGLKFQHFAVRPVTSATTTAAPGEVMLDLQLSLNHPASVYYVVLSTESKVDADEVISTAVADDITSLSRLAVACGELQIPRADTNFTFTISSNLATQECQEYRQLIDGTADRWARAARCARCPGLASSTTYQVHTVHFHCVCACTAAYLFPTS